MGLAAIEFEYGSGGSAAYLAGVPFERYPVLAEHPDRVLHPAELAYFQRLESPRRRTSFLVGRHAAKSALSAYLGGVRFETLDVQPGFFGHPVVSQASPATPAVSLSHDASRAVAVAFSEAFLVGIDVETVDGSNADAIDSVFTPREIEAVRHGPFEPEVARTVYWTAREALAKAIRCGWLAGSEALEVSGPSPDGGLARGEGWMGSAFAHFPALRCDSWVLEHEVVSIVTPDKLRAAITAATLKAALGDAKGPQWAQSDAEVVRPGRGGTG